MSEFAVLLKLYGIGTVWGDRYAGEWPRERFHEQGISYAPTKRTKGELYAGLLPAINRGRVELLDHPRLVGQLCALERRTAWGDRDAIDHGPDGRDDLANAVAGALVLGAQPRRLPEVRARVISVPIRSGFGW